VLKDEKGNESNFYHHGVVRQDKETTKSHIVFDGSAKTKSNVSLNDCLAKGYPFGFPHPFEVQRILECGKGLPSDIY